MKNLFTLSLNGSSQFYAFRFYIALLVMAIITSCSNNKEISFVDVEPDFSTEINWKKEVDIISPKAGVIIESKIPLGKTLIESYEVDTKISDHNSSIRKIVRIHPENDENLNASFTFNYKDHHILKGVDEEKLILYSSCLLYTSDAADE